MTDNGQQPQARPVITVNSNGTFEIVGQAEVGMILGALQAAHKTINAEIMGVMIGQPETVEEAEKAVEE